jgi:hypothetical protein
VLALGVASWQVNDRQRARAGAMRRYLEPFSSNCVIVLPTEGRIEALADSEDSPFIPAHDSFAGHQIQDYLEANYKCHVPIVAGAGPGDLHEIEAKNLILIGGPKFNGLTEELMNVLWDRRRGRYFHWSFTLAKLPETRSLVDGDSDCFLKVDGGGSGLRIDDRVEDPRDPQGAIVEARGMCLRLTGLTGRGRHVLLLAGASTAYGTLAAVDFVTNPDNILPLAAGDSQAIVGASLARGKVGASTAVRVVAGSD